MKYRAEIDGLRAFAVLPVIFFHAGFELFQGGFVGVDVFFVISGYLITTIIVSEIENGKFSLAHFYERRARRILPAMVLVIFVSIPFAWLYLSADEMQDFAQSLIAVATFSSNILFWTESGYFDTAAELKPMLHTWSLAVEEQYYLFFPPFLMLLWKFGLRAILSSLIALFFMSLMLGHWGAYNQPSAAFFLLPTRGWEILLGAFCAFYLHYRVVSCSHVVANISSFSGLLMILASVFLFSANTPTPSLYTLLPTVGVALIILFAQNHTLTNKILRWRPFVAIGLISYSAYLWHQPLFAFTRKALHEDVSNTLMLSLSVLALFLGWLSWRTIERPFRHKTFLSRNAIFSYSFGVTLIFITLGSWGHFTKGYAENPSSMAFTPKVLLNDHDIFLVGDSHAGHLIEGLVSVTSGTVEKHTASGCIPLLNVDRVDYRGVLGECAKTMTKAINTFIESDKHHTLIISSMGPVYLDGTSFRNKDAARVVGNKVTLMSEPSLKDHWQIYEKGLHTTFAALNELSKKNVYFILDIPELGFDKGCNPQAKEIQMGDFKMTDGVSKIPPSACKIPKQEFVDRTQRYTSLVKTISESYKSIKVIDTQLYFCDANWCYGHKEGVGYLYQDSDHLSIAGSHYLAEKLAGAMKTKS